MLNSDTSPFLSTFCQEGSFAQVFFWGFSVVSFGFWCSATRGEGANSFLKGFGSFDTQYSTVRTRPAENVINQTERTGPSGVKTPLWVYVYIIVWPGCLCVSLWRTGMSTTLHSGLAWLWFIIMDPWPGGSFTFPSLFQFLSKPIRWKDQLSLQKQASPRHSLKCLNLCFCCYSSNTPSPSSCVTTAWKLAQSKWCTPCADTFLHLVNPSGPVTSCSLEDILDPSLDTLAQSSVDYFKY